MLAVSVFTAFEPFPFLATNATIPTTPQMMQRSAPVQRSAEYWAAEGATVAASKPQFKEMKLDLEKNKIRGEEAVISAEDSKVKVVVIPTDEELMIASDTMAILNKK